MKNLPLKKLLLFAIAIPLLILLENCCYDCEYDKHTEWGYKPEYSTDIDDIVKLESPQPLKRPGKIYSYKNYLLINELQKGFHVIDNSDPTSPTPLHFLTIAGSNDVAIKNDIIYADQFDNLIVVSLDSVAEVIEKKLIEDVFLSASNYYDIAPDKRNVYYECPDPSFGVVVDWYADSVDYPCYNY